MPGALGRRVPPDWKHVDRFPLSSAQAVAMAPTPVAIGVNWYPAFDSPEKRSDGHYYVRMPPVGQRERGGHCVALKPRGVSDTSGWWDFYDQGREGACVGFGCSRVMTLMNRRRYVARWLWDRAKERDQWSDTNPGDDEGTSVRAGLAVLRDLGHVPWLKVDAGMDAAARFRLMPVAQEGIREYRWIRSVSDLLEVLGYQDLGYVDVINSWGRSYPHLTRFPVEVIERLWREDGEFGVVVDR